ncbi:MAG TPA: ribosomal protein S18-alanine N-acetyltransferase [Polyangiaceae bacterium]|nr:ribosomal protein S18-alanine N-acetyltransferase [Polyangiaceae bacterium]
MARAKSTVTVTSAREGDVDADAVAAIDRACFSQNTLDIRAELDRPWAHVWVARPRGEGACPRAFLLAWLVADELHILSVATSPPYRRRGLARELLAHSIVFAQGRGVRTILLEVRRSNAAAIRLYREFGFAATGIRANYYADDHEDAIVMALLLDPQTGAVEDSRDEIEI